MADKIEKILSVRVEGLDRQLKTIGELEGAYADLSAEVGTLRKGTREYVKASQELEKVETALNDVAAAANKAGAANAGGAGSLKKLEKGIGSIVSSFGKLTLAIQATGIGALIQVVMQLAGALQRFGPVLDLVENGMAALSAAASSVFDAFTRLVAGDFAGALEAATSGLARNATAAFNNADAVRAAEDAIRDYAEAEQRLGKEIDVLLRQTRDRSRTEKERLALIEQAGNIEAKLTAQQLANSQALLQAKEREFALNSQDAALEDELAALRARVAGEQRAAANLSEKLDLRRNALLQEIKADEEASSKAAVERRNQEADARLRQAQAEIALAQARLAADQSQAAAEERLRLTREAAEAGFRNRLAKGEEVLAAERTRVNVEYETALAAVRQQFADKAEAERQRQAEAEAALLARIGAANVQQLQVAEAELRRLAEDQSAQLTDRLEALQEQASVERARIKLQREQALNAKELSAAEIEAIHLQTEAALGAVSQTKAAGEAALVAAGGGLLPRLLGLGTAEEVAQFQALFNQAISIATDALFSFLARGTEDIQRRAAEAGQAVTDAEGRVAEAQQQQADLRDRLASADLAQRGAILAAIQREAEAERKAAQAAQAAEVQKQRLEDQARRRQKNTQRLQVLAQGAQAALAAFGPPPVGAGPLGGTALLPLVGIQTALALAAVEAQSFAKGGPTGPGYGRPDGSGLRVAGVVHGDEYVANPAQYRNPANAMIFSALEHQRIRGYAEGGPTPAFSTAPSAPSVPALDVDALAAAIARTPIVVSVEDVALGLGRRATVVESTTLR